MEVVVESFAEGVDLADTVFVEGGQQVFFSHLDADHQVPQIVVQAVPILRRRLKGAAQIIRGAEQVAGEVGDAEFARLLALALGPFAGVLQLGEGAQQLVFELRVLGRRIAGRLFGLALGGAFGRAFGGCAFGVGGEVGNCIGIGGDVGAGLLGGGGVVFGAGVGHGDDFIQWSEQGPMGRRTRFRSFRAICKGASAISRAPA